MGKNWDYAELSKMASEAGGPEKLLEMVKNEELAKGIALGIKQMKDKMPPMLACATGVGVVGTLVVQGILKRAAKRKEERQASAERAAQAEEILVSCLKNECKLSEQDVNEEDAVSLEE